MIADGKPGLPMSTMTRSWRGVVVPITTPKEIRIVAEDGGLCFRYLPFIWHCIPAEDLLPQRKHTGRWESLFNRSSVGLQCGFG
jgi:hypothetical protein